MNRNLLVLASIGASALAAVHALGQTNEDQALWRIELRAKPNPNQFWLSYRAGFNISAGLQNIGTAPAPIAGQAVPPSVTGVTYKDGYVAYPTPTNTTHLTWYWGYANSSQIVTTPSSTNLFLTFSGSGPLSREVDGDPQHGLEAGYSRRIGQRDWGRWGFETAFDYANLTFRAGVADPAVLSIDSFQVPGTALPLPQAPYAHGPTGPGYLIGDTPTHHPANILSAFDASAYGIKLGPYIEFPFAERLSFTLSGGFALVLADTNFRIQQSVTLPGVGTTTTSITDSDLGVLPGGYVAGRLSVAVWDTLSLFTSVEYQNTGRYSHVAGDKRAQIDMSNSIFVSAGLSYAF